MKCPKCRSKLELRQRHGFLAMDDLELVEATEDADDRYQRERDQAYVALAVLVVILVVLVVLIGAFVLEYPSVFDMYVNWLRLSLQSLLQ
jgi:hypothetical protein